MDWTANMGVGQRESVLRILLLRGSGLWVTTGSYR